MNSDSLTYLLAIFGTRLRDNLDKRMKEIGLHGGQVFILHLLWNNDGQSQAELMRSLNLSAPSIYNMVVRLTENGFTEIRKDDLDGRIMRVFLTPKGREWRDLVAQQWEVIEQQAFANLTEPEKMMLSMLMKKLTNGS